MRIRILSSCVVATVITTLACAERRVTEPMAPRSDDPNALAPGTRIVEVTPDSRSGWAFISINTQASQVSFARLAADDRLEGLSASAHGFRLRVGTGPVDGALVRTVQFAGTPLSELTTLRFNTLVLERGDPSTAPVMTIGVDVDGDGYVDDHLLFHPKASAGRWETWDALHGTWQSSSRVGSPDTQGNRSLAAYLADAPKARLMSAITVGAWRAAGSRPLVAYVDDVVVGVRDETTAFRFNPPY